MTLPLHFVARESRFLVLEFAGGKLTLCFTKDVCANILLNIHYSKHLKTEHILMSSFHSQQSSQQDNFYDSMMIFLFNFNIQFTRYENFATSGFVTKIQCLVGKEGYFGCGTLFNIVT